MDNLKSKVTITENKHQGTRFPKAILSVSRTELDGVELTIKKGLTEEETSLPDDLLGHLFAIAPAGTLDSPLVDGKKEVVRPSANGWTPLFNGDGMVYRIDFDAGKASLTNRLLKTPCYYADLATHQQEKYHSLRFRNLGFGRVSAGDKGVLLGFRNQLNTAFVPFKFTNDAQRLLVTWDTGRPFEIDPRTLELIAPVGWNKEWKMLLALPGVNPPFAQVMTSAHPGIDPHTDEMFTVNIGKALSSILWLSRSLLPKLQSILKFLKAQSNSLLFRILEILFSLFVSLFRVGETIFERFSQRNFVYLLRWTGKEIDRFRQLKQWKLVTKRGKPINIRQTLHQMGITQDYIVLADTSFKFDLGEVLPYTSVQAIADFEVLDLDLTDYPELPYTNIYIVRRDDLKSDKHKIFAQKLQIPLAMAHYLVDYDNPDGKITLHTEHMCATDPSETLRSTDHSVFDNPQITSDLQQLGGSVGGAMDLSRLGCHVIDVASGRVESKYISNVEYTWSTAFYAYRNETPTKKFEDIYWNSWGCWTDTLSKHIYNLYKNYPNRTVPLENQANEGEKPLEQYFREGVPSSICRLHIDRQDGSPQLELPDRYLFPQGYLGTSIQFIPKANSQGTTEGYLVCVVVHSDSLLSSGDKSNWSINSELWILDAANLAAGPLYRMSHPQLNFGFTLHTTWLASLGDSTVRSYDVRQDYEWLLDCQPIEVREQMRELFEQEVYPHYNSDRFVN